MATLNSKSIGNTIKIRENGAPAEFLIVHKGNPDPAIYDSSCDGVWVFRNVLFQDIPFNKTTNSSIYETSTIREWLNNEYWNTIDQEIRDKIPFVKIPYTSLYIDDDDSDDNRINIFTGANGLSSHVFIPSAYELGFTEYNNTSLPVDGANLSYFSIGTSSYANDKRIRHLEDGRAMHYVTRTNYDPKATTSIIGVTASGGIGFLNTYIANFNPIPVIMILPYDLVVNSDGEVVTNTAPTITANKSGSLGTLTSGFDLTYSVSDADNDAVTVTEKLDSKQIRSYKATLGKQETYSLKGNDWISLANGSHTFTITATDGTETVTHTITFTRNNRAPVITMTTSGDAGTLTDDFDLTYSITDADNDAVTVTETLDSKQLRQYAAVLGQQEIYGIRGEDWLQVENGQHTFSITASDGQQVPTKSFVYTRNQTSLSVTLDKPLDADDKITACTVKVKGAIPTDAEWSVFVTNNALDDEPVWEDCTSKVKIEMPYAFQNKEAKNGFAFNFKVSISRGSSGLGGYITSIEGGFA